MPSFRFPPRSILIPTDLSGASSAAIAYGRMLRDRFGAAIRVVHAHYFDMPPYFSSGQIDLLKRELLKSRRQAEEFLRRQVEPALGADAEVNILEQPAVEAILGAARGHEADLILMGTHGRQGAQRMWLGSVTERVIREADRPVLAVRESWDASPVRHVFCPFSFSPAGQAALDYAVRISNAVGARLTVLHAVEPGAKPVDCGLVSEDVKRHCEVEEIVIHGNAAATILEAVLTRKPDLMVLGADRKTSLFGAQLSSTTQRLIHAVPVPVIVTPAV